MPAANNQRTCTRGHTFSGEEPCPRCWPSYRKFTFKANVWIYPGTSANWHFVTLPKKESELLRERFGGMKRGWGSLPVTVTIGSSQWQTSIFPDTKAGAYLLPLKSAVRKKEDIAAGDIINLQLEVRL